MVFSVCPNSVKIRKVAEDIIDLPQYRPGFPRADGTPATWCVYIPWEVATKTGFDCTALLNEKGIGWTNANDMYRNGIKALNKGIYSSCLEGNCQYRANNGDLIVVLAFNIYGGSGHVALICPSPYPYEKERGPRIIQAGAKNGVFWMNDIFRVDELTRPIFIKLTRKEH